jgi:hypothetical protein
MANAGTTGEREGVSLVTGNLLQAYAVLARLVGYALIHKVKKNPAEESFEKRKNNQQLLIGFLSPCAFYYRLDGNRFTNEPLWRDRSVSSG